jgi:hypothetical protein
MKKTPTLYEQTLMFAFYIKDCILGKVNKPSRLALTRYLDSVGPIKEYDRTISVSAETVENMLKNLSDGTPLRTKEETLSHVAVLFAAREKTPSKFWEALQSDEQKEELEKYTQAMERYQANVASVLAEALTKPVSGRKKRKGVLGYYEGTSNEPQGDFSLMLFLEQGAHKTQVVGRAKVHYIIKPDMDEYHDLDIKGEILYNKLLMLQYVNVDPKKEHTGNIRLKIEDNGDILYGVFSGHGYPFGNDVEGGVVVQRRPSPN